MRCIHERQMHKHSSYITLTLNDEHLNESYSLDHGVWQRFTKRLRKALSRDDDTNARNGYHFITNRRYGAPPHPPAKISFYMCGEYGEKYGRPHYHAILFGIDFTDKKYWSKSPGGHRLYRSATLEKLWPYGWSTVGDVTFESAAYVARYVMKKRTGDKNKTDYEILDLETGEIVSKKKEYNCMSRNPGIAQTWLKKFHTDVYTTGKVVVRGHQQYPPRYYDKLYKKIDAAALEAHKHARHLEQLLHAEHHTPERLAVQEQVAEAKTRSLKRTLT